MVCGTPKISPECRTGCTVMVAVGTMKLCRALTASGMPRNGYKGTPPTLQDFYRLLQMQPEPEAQGLALSSELFITGTLNTFARHTNVDTQARIIAYDIRELGEQLMPLGMLVTLDAIYNRVIQNWKKGRRTWIFCDEFYRARRSVT